VWHVFIYLEDRARMIVDDIFPEKKTSPSFDDGNRHGEGMVSRRIGAASFDSGPDGKFSERTMIDRNRNVSLGVRQDKVK
jgi:hypothetical protein